ASPAMRRQSSALRTSARIASARRPSASISETVPSAAPTSTTATSAPSRASSSETARPKPRAPPVTSALLPSTSPIVRDTRTPVRLLDLPRPFLCAVLIDDRSPSELERTIKLCEAEGAQAFELDLQVLPPKHRTPEELAPV